MQIREVSVENGEESTRAPTLEDLAEFAVSAAIAIESSRRVAIATARQIRLALLSQGLLSAASTWIQSADEATRIEWEYASELRRDHPMWAVAAAALGKTETDIDNLFALAATL